MNSLLHLFFPVQKICRRCFRGNLVSIHNFRINSYLQQFTYGLNRPQVWIGARVSDGPTPRYRERSL